MRERSRNILFMVKANGLIGIQDEFVATINAGISRWSHTKTGGHSGRIYSGAYRNASRKLSKIGFSQEQIRAALKDARDVAELERLADA